LRSPKTALGFAQIKRKNACKENPLATIELRAEAPFLEKKKGTVFRQKGEKHHHAITSRKNKRGPPFLEKASGLKGPKKKKKTPDPPRGGKKVREALPPKEEKGYRENDRQKGVLFFGGKKQLLKIPEVKEV